ncbi:MAG: hypothetical protein ABIQ64_03540 [Candidatus Saccharimonadales bacterium]
MKDFDFDELDRAVNSVLAKKDTPDTGQTDDTNAASTDSQVLVSTQTNDTDHDENVVVGTDDNSNDDAVPIAVSVGSNTSDDSQQEHIDVTTAPSVYQASQDDSSQDELSDEHDETVDTESVEESQPSESSELNTDDTSETSSTTPELDEEDASTDDEEIMSAPEVSQGTTTSLASIPVKRGRFMDVMTPQSNDSKKPMGPRGGVTLTPSSDFSPTVSSDDSASNEPAQPEIATDSAPEIAHDDDTSVSEDSPEVNSDDQEPSISHDNFDTQPESPTEKTDATTPFIPDVPVTKRPLNPLSSDLQNPVETPAAYTQPESTEPVSDQVSLDPTLTATVPKEFDKDIMAVEANETVGESDETHADTTDTTPAAAESIQSNGMTNSVAMAATTAEPHPMFDTSTLGHTDAATHHSPKLTWIVVAASLFIVGAALGVLYFLYGQA